MRERAALDLAARPKIRTSLVPAVALAIPAALATAILLLLAAFPASLYRVFSPSAYLPAHTWLELASIIVSFAIFMVNWQAGQQRRNAQIIFVAVAFFAVAMLDALHAMSFPGMPDFVTPNSTHKGIVYWLAARLVEGSALLGAALIRTDNRSVALMGRTLLATATALVMAVFVLNSFFPQLVPLMFVEGVGLTPLKVELEYGVIALNLAAIVAFCRRYLARVEASIPTLLAALALVVFAELSFTLYQSAYDTYNLLGHLFKVAAYYLIFRALFASSIERPYRELAQSEREHARLYEIEWRKTKELLALGRLLNAALSVDEVLRAVVRAARELLDASGGAILVLDTENDCFVVKASEGIKVPEGRLRVANTLAKDVIATGEVRWTGRALAYPEEPGGWLIESGQASVLAAPLQIDGQAIGAVEAFSSHPNAFGADQAVLLAAFADAASVALRNARAHERIQMLLETVRAREEQLATQNDELAAHAEMIEEQNAEIQAKNVELAEREQELQRRNAEIGLANSELALQNEVTREHEAKLRAIIAAAGDAMFVVDSEQKVVMANPALAELLGPQAEDLLGQPCRLLLTGETADGRSVCEVFCPFKAGDGSPPSSIDASMTRADGRRIWVNVQYGPIRTPDGKISGVVHALRDISERKELERQKDEFLSMAAHDLKSPLTAIKGHAQLLVHRAAKMGRQPEDANSLAIIDEQVGRIIDIVNTLLDLTRIQMGRMELELQLVSLSELARRVVAQFELVAEKHRLVLRAEDAETIGKWDRASIERVLANLVDNAIKYSPAGGEVEIAVRASREQAVIEVKDEGPGIADEDRAKIFDRYYRSTTARGAKGLGLGLYIAKSLVEAHGGRIWAERRPERGSVFGFSLPRILN